MLLHPWQHAGAHVLAQQIEVTTGLPCNSFYWHQWRSELVNLVSPDVVVVNVAGPLVHNAGLLEPLLASGRGHMTLLFGTPNELSQCESWVARANGWASASQSRSFDLLQAIVRSLETVNRRRSTQPKPPDTAGLKFSETLRMVFSSNKAVTLTPCETQILALLVGAGSAGVSRAIALETLKLENGHGSRYVDVVISRLRSKLSKLTSFSTIYCMRGHGYYLVPGLISVLNELEAFQKLRQ